MNQLPGGSIIYDPTVSDSKNEARWQTDNIRRIEHSMLHYFQPEDYRTVTDVMIRRYHYYFQHKLEPRHFFYETMNLLNSMIGLTVRQFQSRCLVRDIVSVWPDTVRSMRMDDLRWHVSMLTNAGLMIARFRTHESEDDADAMIRFPGQSWNPHNLPSNLGALPWGGGALDESNKEKPLVTPPLSSEQSETEYMSQGSGSPGAGY